METPNSRNELFEINSNQGSEEEQENHPRETLHLENLDEKQQSSFRTVKDLLHDLNNQTGLSMPESTFQLTVDDHKVLRELNEDFTISRVEEGIVCCSSITIFDRIPTRFLAFSFMIVVGVIVGCLSVAVDICIRYIHEIDARLSVYIENNLFANYGLHLLFSFFLLFTATVITQFIGPNAKGSGIPEMKTILSGVWLHKYLSFEVLFSKLLGTSF